MSLIKLELEDKDGGKDIDLRVSAGAGVDLKDPKTFAEVLSVWLVQQALEKAGSGNWKQTSKKE